MDSLLHFIQAHWNGPIMGLFGLAVVMTMPAKLPWPFDQLEIINWLWGWIHDATQVFVNMRGAKSPPTLPPGAPNVKAEETPKE